MKAQRTGTLTKLELSFEYSVQGRGSPLHTWSGVALYTARDLHRQSLSPPRTRALQNSSKLPERTLCTCTSRIKLVAVLSPVTFPTPYKEEEAKSSHLIGRGWKTRTDDTHEVSSKLKLRQIRPQFHHRKALSTCSGGPCGSAGSGSPSPDP